MVVDAPPDGPKLHRRRYKEVFVVQEGSATFTAGDNVIEATGGQVVVPAGVAHKVVTADPDEAQEILRELGMSEDIEHISSQDGRYNVVIPIALRERISSEGSYSDSVEISGDRTGENYMEDV